MKLVFLTVAEISKAKHLVNALVANPSDNASVAEARKFLSDLRIQHYPAPKIMYQMERNAQKAVCAFYLALVTITIMCSIADIKFNTKIDPREFMPDVIVPILHILLVLSIMHPLSNFYTLPTLKQAAQNTRNFVPNLIENTRRNYHALPTLKQATQTYINGRLFLHHIPALFTTASTAKTAQLSIDVEPLRDADLDKMDASQILNFYKDMVGEVFLGLSAYDLENRAALQPSINTSTRHAISNQQ